VIGLVALINIFKLNIGNIIFSAFTLFLAWYEMDYSSSQLGSYSSLVTKGAGYYLLTIGAVVMLIAAIVGLVINIKRKVAFKRGY
jgi:TRAP-type C4-dicarboxylate transport system permease small subunit